MTTPDGPRASGARRAIIVCHTHWDREWYRPYQEFRLALVEVLDELLDALDAGTGPPVALLDGQTVLLDDYLELRPGRRESVRRHAAAGRLLVGPWYVEPDEFLVSGEALVRNLLHGRRGAVPYGGAMPVGYLADQFGHIAQLPQILRGFGIGSAVFWRGRARDGASEFWWEAPDESRVLAVHLSDGYGAAAWLPLEPRALARRVRELYDALGQTATSPTRLLMNGMDHQRFQVALPAALAAATPHLAPDLTVEIGSLATYVDAVVDAARDGALAVERGEYRSPRSSPLLPGVLSTRAPLKRRNAAVQTLLEREAEPWSALAGLLGLLPRGYPQAELDLAWSYLLQNHPHDSICGCSLDQVAREMETRYDWAEQIAAGLTLAATTRLARAVETRPAWAGQRTNSPDPHTASAAQRSWRPPGAAVPDVVALVTFNAADVERTDRARVALTLPGSGLDYEVIDADGAPVPYRWLGEQGEPTTEMEVPLADLPPADTVMAQIPGDRVMDMGVHDARVGLQGEVVVAEVTLGEQSVLSRLEIEEVVRYTERLIHETRPARAVLRIHRSTRLELEYLAREVPAHGYATFWLRRRAATADRGDPEPGARSWPPASPGATGPLETDLFSLSVDPLSGALSVVDRRDGTVYAGCNVMEDAGEAGDTYTHAPPARDTIVRIPAIPPRVEVEADPLGVTLRVDQELRVPVALTAARSRRAPTFVSLPIESTIQLTHGVPRVDITTRIDNVAEDHRLRVGFLAPFAADHVHAEDAFTVTRRAATAAPGAEDWAEQPAGTAPLQGFVAIHDGATPSAGRSMLLAGHGLHEYEAVPVGDSTEVLLTLLRCVGWLSREDLVTRRGHAGPALPTPGAQCPGAHTIRYSMIPHAGAWREAVPLARAAACPLRTVPIILTGAERQPRLPARAGFLRVSSPGVAVTALKGAEDGHGVIVRMCNMTDAPAGEASLSVGRDMPALRVTITSLAEVDNSGEPRELPTGSAGLSLQLGPAQVLSLRLSPVDAEGS